MKVKVNAFGVTDIGRRRERNEDQFLIGELSGSMAIHHTSIAIQHRSTVFGESQGHLFLVADGLGGHAAGERASSLAIAAVSSYALNGLQWLVQNDSDEDQTSKLQAIGAECQKRLIESARQHPNERGMATTLTLAIVIWPKLYIIHIGDSRCYLFRRGELKQLTRDHTLGQLYSERADLPADGGANHALWNVVSSQGEASPIADVVQAELTTEDQLMLCTDGLYNHVDDREMAEGLTNDRSPQDTCEHFVALANERGGHDNITVVVSRFARCEPSHDSTAMVETRVPFEEVINTSQPLRDPHDTDEFPTPKFAEELDRIETRNESS